MGQTTEGTRRWSQHLGCKLLRKSRATRFIIISFPWDQMNIVPVAVDEVDESELADVDMVDRGQVALKRVALIGKHRNFSTTYKPVFYCTQKMKWQKYNHFFFLFGFFFFAADALAPALTGVPDRLCSSTSIFTPNLFGVPDRMGVGVAIITGGGLRFVIFSINERFSASNRLRKMDECVLYFRHYKFSRQCTLNIETNYVTHCRIVRNLKHQLPFRRLPLHTIPRLPMKSQGQSTSDDGRT